MESLLFLFALWLSLLSAVTSQVYSGSLRLKDGRSQHEGNVQVFYQGRWGYVCHDMWNSRDANVVCRQLGYPATGSSATRRSHFSSSLSGGQPSSSAAILLDNVVCNGSELMLVQCNHGDWGVHDCNERDYAGVVCQAPPDISTRLVPDTDEYRGVVEISTGGFWYKIIIGPTTTWSAAKSDLVCRNMGYTGALSYRTEAWSPPLSNLTGDVGLAQLSCAAEETSVSRCRLDPLTYAGPVLLGSDPHRVLAVACQSHTVDLIFNSGKLRRFALITIGNASRLRPPVQSNVMGVGCGDWSNHDAQVVCKQAGFSGLNARQKVNLRNFPSVASWPKISSLGCHGNETGIALCPNPPSWSSDQCSENFATQIRCQAPSPRIQLVSSSGPASALVQWTVDHPVALHLVTSYVVTHSAGPPVVFAPSTEGPFRVEGLSPYTLYSFTVRVITVYGESKASDAVSFLTPTDIPSISPRIHNVTAHGSRSVVVRVNSLTNQQGINGPLVGYRLQYFETASPTNVSYLFYSDAGVGNGRLLTVPLLAPHTNYSVRVALVSVNGTGPYSQSSLVTTDQDLPSKVLHLKAVALSDSSVRLSWQPPAQPNGIITGYTVLYRPLSPHFENVLSSVIVRRRLESIVLQNLEAFVSYSVAVYATTVVGAGEAENTTVRLYPAAPSGAPIMPRAQGIDSTSVNISWEPPTFMDRNGPIANYSVQFRIAGEDFEKDVRTNGLWLVLRNLTDYTLYEYRVSAVGLYNGTGTYSPVFTDDLHRKPGPVSRPLISSIRATSCVLRWGSPTWQNGKVSLYLVRFTSVGDQPRARHWFNVTPHSDPVLHLVHGLQEWVEYRITISAVNQHGAGQPVFLNGTTESTAPSAPPGQVYAVLQGSRGLTVSWFPPPPLHQNGPITSYILHYGQEGALVVNKLSLEVNFNDSLDPSRQFTTSLNTDGLSPNVKYLIQVAAKTDMGEGPFSIAQSFVLEDDSSGAIAAAVIGVIFVIAVLVAAVLVALLLFKRSRKVQSVLQTFGTSSNRRHGHIYEEPKSGSSKTSSFENIYDVCGTPGNLSSEGISDSRGDLKSSTSALKCQSGRDGENVEEDDVSIVDEDVLDIRSKSRPLHLSKTPEFVDNPQYGSVPETDEMSTYSIPIAARPRGTSAVSLPLRKECTSTDHSTVSTPIYSVPKASFTESVIMSELEQRAASLEDTEQIAEADMYVLVNSGRFTTTPRPLDELCEKTDEINPHETPATKEPDCVFELPYEPMHHKALPQYPDLTSEDPSVKIYNIVPGRIALESEEGVYSHLWKEALNEEDVTLRSHCSTPNPYGNFTDNAYLNVSGVPRIHDHAASESEDSAGDDDDGPLEGCENDTTGSNERDTIYDVPRKIAPSDLYSIPSSHSALYAVPRSLVTPDILKDVPQPNEMDQSPTTPLPTAPPAILEGGTQLEGESLC